MPTLNLELSYSVVVLSAFTGIEGGTCVGQTKSGQRCKRRRAKAICARIATSVKDLWASRSNAENRDLQDELVVKLLCRDHDKQEGQIDHIREALRRALNQVWKLPTSSRTNTRLSEKTTSPSKFARSGALSRAPRTHSVLQFEEDIDVHGRSFHIGKRSMESGFIYIFRNPEMKGLVKIGFSDDISRRMKSIRRACHITPHLVTDRTQRRIKHAYLAEQIILDELESYQKKFKCKGCGKEHREWFQVDEVKALEVIERWRCWIEDKYGIASESESWTRSTPRTSSDGSSLDSFLESDHQGRNTELVALRDEDYCAHVKVSQPFTSTV
jgi:hypothetical protein